MHPSYGEELNVGDRIAGRYEILSEIGKGSMGVVYKARHDILGRIVAIKMLRVQRMTDDRSRARFEREARAAELLSHPNLISVMDFGYTPESVPYLIMDFVSGVGLLDILRQEKVLAPERAVALYAQVCDAIYHAHQRGVIHRDLKPGNIIIDKDENGRENVKIVDLGVAKIVLGAEDDAPAITGTGEVCGSPIYLSPEQCMHLELDARTDIYSLGVCLYESLTGVPPLRGATVYDTIYMHVHETPKPFSAVAPNITISPRLEEIVLRCLSKNPEERYETMERLKLALLDTLQPVPAQPVHVLPPEVLFRQSSPPRVAKLRQDSLESAPAISAVGNNPSSKSVFILSAAGACVIAVVASLFVYINDQNQRIKELESKSAALSRGATGGASSRNSVPKKSSSGKPRPATAAHQTTVATHQTSTATTHQAITAPAPHASQVSALPVGAPPPGAKTPPVLKDKKDGSLFTAFGALQMQDWQKSRSPQGQNMQKPAVVQQRSASLQAKPVSALEKPAHIQQKNSGINQPNMRRIELPAIRPQSMPVREIEPESRVVDKADSPKPGNAAAQIAEDGRNLALIHDYAGAAAKFRQVHQMEPTNQYYSSCLAHALTSEALLLNKQGNYKGAVVKQKEAAELFPENQLYQNNLRKFEANSQNFSAGQ